MSVLIIKNVQAEGPGTIGEYLLENSIEHTVVELGQGEALPRLDGYDTLIVLGGPMAVYEEDACPYLADETVFVREAIESGLRVLGVCLGAQVIAKALGARVQKGPEVEVGWHKVKLSAEGFKDPLMRCLAVHPSAGDFWKEFKVFHWHGDTFDVPEGAVRLAGSGLYENQAFRYQRNVYGLQFHVEVTPEMVEKWMKGLGGEAAGRIIDETATVYEVYHGRALNFYKAFFSGRARNCEDKTGA